MLTAYKRCHWFNSDFHSGFVLNDNQKISEISFDVNPFQINVNNNIKVITYVRDATQSRPIQIKLKEPYNQSREVFNDDNEAFPIIYTNHTGTEGMGTYYPYSIARLVPQQIPRFTFRVDDNYNQFIGNSYITSLTNGEILPVAMGAPTEKYIIFKSSGSFTLTDKMIVDILVVGGGGSGGIRGAGGGGAGAVIYNTNKTLNSGTYTITIGAGGFIIRDTDKTANANGKDTTINYNGTNIYIAKGGGAGSTGTGGGYLTAQNGGSGGGSTYQTSPAGTAFNTENEPDGIYGNSGGVGSLGGVGGGGEASYSGGGGGGAGSIGIAGVNNTTTNRATGGDGGNGIQISITGTPIYYGAGGGGGCGVGGDRAGLGGLGGGGNGGLSTTAATSALPNTGSGGGGSGFSGLTDGVQGNGGSGVVIIRYREQRNRIEGITPEETLIQATNTNIPITIDSQYQINYQTPVVLPKGTYSATFAGGAISLASKPDYNYPTTSNFPNIWYKFDTNSFLIDNGSSASNLTSVNVAPTANTNIFTRGDSSALFIRNTTTPNYLTSIVNLTTPFTISFWFNVDNANNNSPFGIGADNLSPAISCTYNSSTNKIMTYLATPNTWNTILTSTATININTWYHYTLIVSNTNPVVCSLYINGVLDTSGNGVGAFSTDNKNLRIGIRGDLSPVDCFGGYIDDFRIYKSVLSPVEIYDLYNGNSDRSYPILKDANGVTINPLNWYKFDNSFTDSGTEVNNLTNSGSTFDSTNYVKGGYSVSFNGSSSCYFTNSVNLYSIQTTNGITFSFWFKALSTSVSYATLLEFSNGAGYRFYIRRNVATDNLTFGSWDNYNYIEPTTTGTNYFNNTWYHIVWSITTTGVWSIYANGVNTGITATRSFTSGINYNSAYKTIGSGGNGSLTGNIDDFRIYSQVLTAAQVSELYTGRLAIYNPPGFILGTEIEPEAE